MTRLKENILATLAYFDMFGYPITYEEIFHFLNVSCDDASFASGLNSLVEQGVVFRLGAFYSLKKDPAAVTGRVEGNRRADELLKIAARVGKLLIKFPFVRGVGISGSLSKNYAAADADIDLFIITRQNRLWIARTLMHCFKKLTFLVNRQHYYCMNYYVDEIQLEIVEKNIYTAVEIATLIPLQGQQAFREFYAANCWVKNFLPHKPLGEVPAIADRKNVCKEVAEWLLDGSVGNWLEKRFMRITGERWNKKTRKGKLNMKGDVMTMVVGRHFSKPDPADFQVRFFEGYQHKLAHVLNRIWIEVPHGF